eukprot:SAG11_NODE_35992_length_264_cov_0.563636_1_plen_51_part_10
MVPSSISTDDSAVLTDEQREHTRAAWEAGLLRITDEHALRWGPSMVSESPL